MGYQYIYGPVNSRRLGLSLGVDLLGAKVCSFNCVYCERGRTDQLTVERKEYVAYKEVTNELKDFLAAGPKLNYISFSGCGEPLLHKYFGRISAYLKENFPRYKQALLTNSSLITAEIMPELKNLDLIVPSLDAVSENTFKKINRPHKTVEIDKIITNIAKAKKELKAKMWLEIFLLPGINDHQEELELFKKAVQTIKADKIQLNSLDRPGAENWLEKMSKDRLREIADFLGDNVEIVAGY
ncbi:radical SAM protein [Halanaerobium hydrogeniformans]|uniref:Radical SAM domain protein n=1 Tax=Halanaerobium hydrogeniformans TaxID=656519 RepID=E4RN21_HALHG|nr:radical SAM protein [Halanaerobium hydrogeniformans]ADQ14238.1 Radical SAM domain protein [Halanaerobium hydrogeniformans]